MTNPFDHDVRQPDGSRPSSTEPTRRQFVLGASTAAFAVALPWIGRAATAQAASVSSFVHPGVLHDTADLSRMATKVQANASPWFDDWQLMLGQKIASTSWKPDPRPVVYAGNPDLSINNSWVMQWDIHSAYINALNWHITQNTDAADAAVRSMNAWASTLQSIWVANGYYSGFLIAGMQGYQWATVGELMRDYDGWSAADLAQFQAMLESIFLPMASGPSANLANPSSLIVRSNWELSSLAGTLGMAIFLDDQAAFDAGIAYYKQGLANGAADMAVYFMHPGYLGQTEEAGRDQGHDSLSVALLAVCCELAWKQGVDLYGYSNNRALAGLEYVAKGNLIESGSTYYSVPYTPYENPVVSENAFSTNSQGAARPAWALPYNHYVNRLGIAAPYSGKSAAQVAPETGSDYPNQNGWEVFGFGTLTCTLDPIAVGLPPSGLTAVPTDGNIVLSWWGTAYATSYNVQRSALPIGPFTTIASGISDLLTYSDEGLADGTYYYVVTAETPTGETVPSNVAQAVAGTSLRGFLQFNEGVGAVALDSSGNGFIATLAGGAGWGQGHSGTALALNGTGAYAALPDGFLAGLGDFTFAAWVLWNGGAQNQRIFDFGSDINHWMMLSPSGPEGCVEFGITLNQQYGETTLRGPDALPSGEWVHVAVTMSGVAATLYLDGSAVASNPDMRYQPNQIGESAQNWLGRSQSSGDPSYAGRIDDFRFYQGALSATQIEDLASGLA